MRADHSYPRSARVRRRSDFLRAYDEGTKVVCRPLVLFARPNGLAETRLGVTATRKLGNAVVRGRAKRLVREAFRSIRDELCPGWDLVVVVRPDLLALRPETIAGVLLEAGAGAMESPA